MTLVDIDKVLQKKNLYLDENIALQIKDLKADAIRKSNEKLANILWCYD